MQQQHDPNQRRDYPPAQQQQPTQWQQNVGPQPGYPQPTPQYSQPNQGMQGGGIYPTMQPQPQIHYPLQTQQNIPVQHPQAVQQTSPARPGEIDTDVISALVLQGDLSKMLPVQKVQYYNMLCNAVGLKPELKPFDLLNLSGKEVLYANKACTEQLRMLHHISVVEMKHETVQHRVIEEKVLQFGQPGVKTEVNDDMYIVTTKVRMANGREDISTGAVSLGDARGEMRANVMMKAETKSKRRATLSLCGLGGILDETEADSIAGAVKKTIDLSTGNAQPLSVQATRSVALSEKTYDSQATTFSEPPYDEVMGNVVHPTPQNANGAQQPQNFIDASPGDGLDFTKFKRSPGSNEFRGHDGQSPPASNGYGVAPPPPPPAPQTQTQFEPDSNGAYPPIENIHDVIFWTDDWETTKANAKESAHTEITQKTLEHMLGMIRSKDFSGVQTLNVPWPPAEICRQFVAGCKVLGQLRRLVEMLNTLPTTGSYTAS